MMLLYSMFNLPSFSYITFPAKFAFARSSYVETKSVMELKLYHIVQTAERSQFVVVNLTCFISGVLGH